MNDSDIYGGGSHHPRPDNRWPLVIGLSVVAFVYSYSIAGGGPVEAVLAGALGGTFGLLILPAVAALIASRSTRNWHYAFAAAFVIVFGLVLFGRTLR